MRDSARSYAYAKACGLLATSYVGHTLEKLYGLRRPSELDRLLFPQAPLNVPERELPSLLERRITERSIDRILRVLSAFDAPPAILPRLLRSYEYADLKAALAALAAASREAPQTYALGPYSTVRFEHWPDLPAMVADTEFNFIAEKPRSDTVVALATSLDLQYYRSLWSELSVLPAADRSALQDLFAEEIRLRNVFWALRLSIYYRLGVEDIDARLIDIPYQQGSLADAARHCLQFPQDDRSAWARWPYAAFLNPARSGEAWRPDPRQVQNAASRALVRDYRKLFRRDPFSIAALAAWIRMMQSEEDLLTSIAEGLSLGLSARDVVRDLELVI